MILSERPNKGLSDDTPLSYAAELPYWLALNRTFGMGPATLKKLLPYYQSPRHLVNNAKDAISKFSLPARLAESLKNPDWKGVEQDLAWLNSNDSSDKYLLTWDDPQFPEQLKVIDSPPIVLFARGKISLLSEPQLGIVGSRVPTSLGHDTAFSFAADLASKGLTITSGLALGIDAAAHQGALSVQGDTIAVMGTGLERVYPAKHHKLAHQIAQNGLLLSEFTPDTTARAEYFPRRNRIISGLSLGILVVEAALKSGSLISARLASEQGKEVFAIPGSIHNPLARGCHALIRQGAKLVESSQDIIEELAPQLQRFINLDTHVKSAPTVSMIKNDVLDGLSESQQALLNWIQFEVTSVDVMALQSGLPIDDIYSNVMMLELAGVVKSVAGGYVRIK